MEERGDGQEARPGLTKTASGMKDDSLKSLVAKGRVHSSHGSSSTASLCASRPALLLRSCSLGFILTGSFVPGEPVRVEGKTEPVLRPHRAKTMLWPLSPPTFLPAWPTNRCVAAALLFPSGMCQILSPCST